MTEHFNVAMKDKQVGLEQWNHTGEVCANTKSIFEEGN